MPDRSPFPGMDPWLERYWGDVHNRLTTYSCDQLQNELQGDLVARMEERVYLESPYPPQQAFRPDVHVVETPLRSGGLATAQGGTATLAEPTIVHMDPIEVTETFIQIMDRDEGGRVITIVEFLSPSNKLPGEGRQKYLDKQNNIKRSDTNLVEIDLIRAGAATTLFGERPASEDRKPPYHACVFRATKKSQLEYYPLFLRAALPRIHIPLRPSDKDIELDLRSLIQQVYEKGRYGRIDYSRPPSPPLGRDDAEWAAEIVRQHPAL